MDVIIFFFLTCCWILLEKSLNNSVESRYIFVTLAMTRLESVEFSFHGSISPILQRSIQKLIYISLTSNSETRHQHEQRKEAFLESFSLFYFILYWSPMAFFRNWVNQVLEICSLVRADSAVWLDLYLIQINTKLRTNRQNQTFKKQELNEETMKC